MYFLALVRFTEFLEPKRALEKGSPLALLRTEYKFTHSEDEAFFLFYFYLVGSRICPSFFFGCVSVCFKISGSWMTFNFNSYICYTHVLKNKWENVRYHIIIGTWNVKKDILVMLWQGRYSMLDWIDNNIGSRNYDLK